MNKNGITISAARYLWLTLFAVLLLVAAFVLYVRAEESIGNFNRQRDTSFQLAYELRQSSDDLTRMVRAYALTGNPLFKAHFHEILDIRHGLRPRPLNYGNVYWDLVLEDDRRPRPFGQAVALLDLMRQAGFTDEELAKLEEAEGASDALTQTEISAMRIIDGHPGITERFRAMSMLNDDAYLKAKAEIMKSIGDFNDMLDRRTSLAVQTAENHLRTVRLLVVGLGLLVALLMWRLLSAINKDYRETADNKQLLDSVVENIPNMIFLKRAEDFRLVLFNKAGEQLLGCDREALLGKNDHDRFPKERADFLVSQDREVLSATDILDIPEEPVDTRLLGQRFLHTKKLALRNSRGEARFILGISEDITEAKRNKDELDRYRYRLEQLVEERTSELVLARDAAEAASRAKSVFLANMSHELHTPMNAIMGMTELALHHTDDPTLHDHLGIVVQASRHLLGIINDILDIAKIEAERLKLECVDFRLGDVLDKVRSLTEPKAAKKFLQFDWDMADGVADRMLKGDAKRLGQILLNLVGNAIKFTDRGFVGIRLRLQEETTKDLLLRCEVADSGIGISVEDQARLFTAFEQADGSMTRKYGGTGLGLAISKRLAVLMGGAVGIESAIGRGSTFWFTVRLAQSGDKISAASGRPGEDAEAILKALDPPPSILMAASEPVSREISKGLLEYVGITVVLAGDGNEAVALARRRRYDLIMMATQLSGIGGIDAVKEIRRDSLNLATPILGMTVNAGEDEEAVCLAVGMNGYIAKPLDPHFLFEALSRFLSTSRRQPHDR